MKKKTFSTLFR